jgi:hypothetical protein
VLVFLVFLPDAHIQVRQWHSSQQITELPGGGCRMRLHLSGLEEIQSWILSWGLYATVIAPSALAARIGQLGAQLAPRYNIPIPAEPQKPDASLRFTF